MSDTNGTGRIHTIVIGGGQAGLSVGYWLTRMGVPFLILDASARIGDTWRGRWDSLRLFTPARFDGLAGMPFPAHPEYFPTKDEMADYLEAYAARFALPVRSGTRVDRVTREGGRFVVRAGATRFEADNVVVAMASYQEPRVPAFAAELDPSIVQLHSADYRNPSQMAEGDVLLVGAGNSGAEIAFELMPTSVLIRADAYVGNADCHVSELARGGPWLLRPKPAGEQSGLIDYQPVSGLEAMTDLLVAVPSGADLETAPVAFVDPETCTIVHEED